MQSRIDYIKRFKPVGERQTRLRLMTPVMHPEKLPREWRKAYAKAVAKWREADTKCKEAYAKCLPKIEALHKKEHPDCPWNGVTIFSQNH